MQWRFKAAPTFTNQTVSAPKMEWYQLSGPERADPDVNALRQPDITVWSVWRNANLVGCGVIRGSVI